MLVLDDIRCDKGGRPLLSAFALSVAPGQSVHLTGPNGSGKTTLLRLMAGLTVPDAGTITWKGQPISNEDSGYQVDRLYLGHANGLQEASTVFENLRYQCALARQTLTRERAETLLHEHRLLATIDKPVLHLSQGQKRRVAMIRLELTPSQLWLLDEPLVALDQAAVERLGGLIDRHLAQQGSVVFTSHQRLPLASSPHLKALGL